MQIKSIHKMFIAPFSCNFIWFRISPIDYHDRLVAIAFISVTKNRAVAHCINQIEISNGAEFDFTENGISQ